MLKDETSTQIYTGIPLLSKNEKIINNNDMPIIKGILKMIKKLKCKSFSIFT